MKDYVNRLPPLEDWEVPKALIKEVGLSSQRYHNQLKEAQEDKENASGEKTPAEERRLLEKEIKQLTEKKEASVKDSLNLIEQFVLTKEVSLPEKSVVAKRTAEECEALIVKKKQKLETLLKQKF